MWLLTHEHFIFPLTQKHYDIHVSHNNNDTTWNWLNFSIKFNNIETVHMA